jgi:alpha-ketoglutarate-dependent 2,4-dichlorophenoxyacetate dioxygenase
MTININPLHPVFAGEIEGIDLRSPLSRADISAIEEGMDEFAVLVIRGQNISDEQQAAFSQGFGALEVPDRVSNITKPEDRRLGPQMADISNLNRDNEVLARDDRQRMFNLGNRLWHSDSSFRATPSKFSLLSGRVIPATGGETQFADMRASYEALDASDKVRFDKLVCEHSLLFSRGRLGFDRELSPSEIESFKPARQSLVRTHPVTGRKSLYLSAHAGSIVGWPVPEARIFLAELIEFATQPQWVYTHTWRQYDLAIWDNRQTMHRARPFNDTQEVRDMRRTTVAGNAMTATQAA